MLELQWRGRTQFGGRVRIFFQTHRIFLSGLFTWVIAWTVVFSAIDFWTIKLFHVEDAHWFQDYRAVMRYGASWASPPSFALAENTYFVWMQAFDRRRTMHEWEWYSGNPANPDGHWNFVWGDPYGWIKFPVWKWYLLWSIPTAAWFLGLTFVARRLFGKNLQTQPRGLSLNTPLAPALSTLQEEGD